ncbi:MAG: NosD domain-containing protein [Bacteroidota bacterium]
MRYKLLILSILTVLYISLPCLHAATYIVTSTADAGPGSLREAITLANANPGADIINFDFGVAGVKTITLLSELPDIIDQLFIDGSSDPFYAGVPLVEINANGLDNGLEILNGGDFSHIHALIVNNATFNNGSKGIEIVFTNDVKITGCYLGTDATGTAAIPNTQAGVYVYFADRVTIGGTGPNEGNLISGNGNYGIYCWFANDVMIYGNKVGTDLNGTSSIPNVQGAFLWFCRRGLIGGNTAAQRNLFSGNTGNGIFLHYEGQHKIYGNYVGTDISGTLALPNGSGINVTADSNEIGGILAGQGNLISGNASDGLRISNPNGIGNSVKGNLIGTDPTGTLALPNQRSGITHNNVARTIIGGPTAAERNIISGNGRDGISISNSDSTYIYGNYIGTDISGANPLPNQMHGIQQSTVFHTFIGNGTAAGANVISANAGNGIFVSSSSTTPSIDSVIIKYNYIGTDPTGLLNLANTQHGIFITNGSQGNLVGGHSSQGNIIANNLLGGVHINGAPTTENQILGNHIYDHPLQGISLGGGNNLQAAPDLTGFAAGPGTTTILGNFNSAPSTSYRLEFFTSNTAAQGKTFVGSTNITTDATGFYALNEVLAFTLTAAEPVITATATDPLGNTSEFGVETILNARLSSFTVEALPLRKAQLNWETEGQDAETYFEIEHQEPNADFRSIGKQDQYISLNQSKLYQFEVEKLIPGTHHFRVVEVSTGGLRSYSKSIELEISQESSYQALIPNPINSNSSIDLMLQKSQKVDIHLLDISGKKLDKLFSGEIEEGVNQSISVSELSKFNSGIYILQIRGVDFSLNQKVLLE